MAIPIFCHSVNLKRPPIPFLRRPQLNFRVDIREVGFSGPDFPSSRINSSSCDKFISFEARLYWGDGGIGLKGWLGDGGTMGHCSLSAEIGLLHPQLSSLAFRSIHLWTERGSQRWRWRPVEKKKYSTTDLNEYAFKLLIASRERVKMFERRLRNE